MTDRSPQKKRRRLLLATTNRGKTEELKSSLRNLPLEVYSFRDIPPTRLFEETGLTFIENAAGKSRAYSRDFAGLTLAEDSGLEIFHLGNRPGVFSARFAGPGASDRDNLEKALHLMKGVPAKDRSARFVCCMVLARQGRILKEISAEVSGSLTEEPRGENGFGYDPIFFYPPLKKTFAELGPEEKNRVSHRGRALEHLKEWLKGYL